MTNGAIDILGAWFLSTSVTIVIKQITSPITDRTPSEKIEIQTRDELAFAAYEKYEIGFASTNTDHFTPDVVTAGLCLACKRLYIQRLMEII